MLINDSTPNVFTELGLVNLFLYTKIDIDTFRTVRIDDGINMRVDTFSRPEVGIRNGVDACLLFPRFTFKKRLK